MTLRGKFLLYVAALHVVFAASAIVFLLHHPVWLLGVEAFFAVSALAGVRLVRRLFEPIRLIRSGIQLMQEKDFTTRFRPTGEPELDALIQVYNGMADHLRDERTRGEEQEQFLQRVLTASPSGVLTLDLDGRIVTLNPAARRLVGLACAGPFEGCVLRTLGSAFTDGLAQLAAGETRVLSLGRRRLRCHRGEFFDRGFARPFLLLEELTEELRRSEKAAYDLLIRMMSHEVNNTTGAVTSLLRSCLHYSPQIAAADRADFETALEVSIRRSTHLNQFMKRFADVVRLPRPQPEPCDVHALLEGIVRLVQHELRERDVRVEWDLDGAPNVRIDATQMEQALLNIMRNAMEAIGRDGTITIRLGQRSGTPVLVVEDTGPGLAPGAADKLFTPFFTTKENGQGIGLTLVREILEAHGFDFWLEGPAGGPTRFTIVLG